MVEVDEEPPSSAKLNGGGGGMDSGDETQQNGPLHQEFFIEPEPIRAALISTDIMQTLETYSPGNIGAPSVRPLLKSATQIRYSYPLLNSATQILS